MTIRWFSSAADKTFKKKLRVRRAPSSPKIPRTVYKSPSPTLRKPKMEKPKVDSPYSTPPRSVSELHRMAVSGEDMSLSELENLDQDSEVGPIQQIEWITERSEKCDGLEGRPGIFCRSLNRKKWRSLEEFLNGRTIASAPNGKAVGLYGYSHPGCKCFLRVSVRGGFTEYIGPYSG